MITQKIELDSMMRKLVQEQKPYQVALVSKALNFLVPFNSPHKFKVIRIDQSKVVTEIPYKKINLNHVKGIHACAIATLGEICAGLSIIRDFGFSKYRFILAELKVDYLYQGKTALTGVVEMPNSLKESVQEELYSSGISKITLMTLITDQNNNEVAKVYSTWQLKDWKKVNLKV